MLQCKTSVSAPSRREGPARWRGLVVIVTGFALAGLAGCGQKGPLIAPKPAATASAPAQR